MTFFSEVALVLTKKAFQRLLHKISVIKEHYLKYGVHELLSKAKIYQYHQEHTVFIYWKSIFWYWQGDLAIKEIRFIHDFLTDLNDKEYNFLRIEGGGWEYSDGYLISHYNPKPCTIISKWVDKEQCELLTYPPVISESA